MTRPQRRDRGSIALELTIITPVLLFVLGLTSVGGRIASAHSQVEGAARDAARAASISRGDARADAQAAAEAALEFHMEDANCEGGPKVTLDRDPTPGQPVVATVACEVKLAGLPLPVRVPNKTVTATVASPVDQYVNR